MGSWGSRGGLLDIRTFIMICEHIYVSGARTDKEQSACIMCILNSPVFRLHINNQQGSLGSIQWRTVVMPM